MKRSIIILAMALLWISPALAEDTQGVNFHFSNSDATGTKSSASFNPDGPGTGWSQTFDSGATLNSDGSWSIPLGDGEGNGITVRTAPVFDE
ncbi:MAG: hypothetical protein ISR61_03485 [Desulfobacteraceae bacterium]|uniref:PEP-CTERM sorting domain-containing protein n=1 Tax=Candidatus Desulfacyla euxinica TaxID=2841693 RepID=A0A8J6N0Q5_9DELT|nr:hypothetical protein [Candidatus Desulfacyla euxinica]MBL6977985.1 hypothetical protein [Desulfobacteraceae bacterium]